MASAPKIKETTTEDVSAQLAALKADLAGLTDTIANLGATKASQAADVARDKAAHLRAKGEEGYEYARDQADIAYRQADDFVRTQPATALGIAAGLGFLFGFMSSRR